MASEYLDFELKDCQTAEELWKLLCPTNDLFKKPSDLIYRGQGDASWSLTPSVLRKDQLENMEMMWLGRIKAPDIVFIEALNLERFCEYCDEVGAQIPGDSPEFREKVLSGKNMERYYYGKHLWPGNELDVVMAMAQHHGVPTRFLDWSKIPYVAAYFAASSAVWDEINGELAIWVLNTVGLGIYAKSVRLAEVPGGVSPHLSAQSGLFTVPLHNGTRGHELEKQKSLESILGALPNTPLMKLTLPVEESGRLLQLCGKAGYSGARLFPTLDGAGKAVATEIKWSVADQIRKNQRGLLS